VDLTPALKSEYERLWSTCRVRPERRAAASAVADRIVRERGRYEAAGKPHAVAWYVVGVIHQLEASGNFSTHLHNGDPLTARTVRVPAGRPASGNPPFTWELSASDALVHDMLDTWKDWSIPGTLFVFERFNGFSYRKPEIAINSPYLWSFSTHYTKGKFIRDHVYDGTAVSAQCGAAVLLRELADRGLVAADVLERGDRGPAVVALKRDLKKWFDKNLPGEWARLRIVDSDLFGAALGKAVKTFQARKGMAQSGKVDARTRKALAAG
jgi:lysozyme family protein